MQDLDIRELENWHFAFIDTFVLNSILKDIIGMLEYAMES